MLGQGWLDDQDLPLRWGALGCRLKSITFGRNAWEGQSRRPGLGGNGTG